MPASRPPLAPPRSASTIRLNVLARSLWTTGSPTSGLLPLGMKTSAVDGHMPRLPSAVSSDIPMVLCTVAEIGNPFSASSRAGVTTCSKVIVPYRSSAVSQPSGAPGVTHRRMPSGISPPACSVEVVDGGRPGPPSEPADRHHRVRLGFVDDYRGDPAEGGGVGQSHVDGDAGGYAGVDGIPALLQDAVPPPRRPDSAPRIPRG